VIYVLMCVQAPEIGKRWWYKAPLLVCGVECPEPDHYIIFTIAAVAIPDLGVTTDSRFALAADKVLEVSPRPWRVSDDTRG
jgi:hypothetical protein